MLPAKEKSIVIEIIGLPGIGKTTYMANLENEFRNVDQIKFFSTRNKENFSSKLEKLKFRIIFLSIIWKITLACLFPNKDFLYFIFSRKKKEYFSILLKVAYRMKRRLRFVDTFPKGHIIVLYDSGCIQPIIEGYYSLFKEAISDNLLTLLNVIPVPDYLILFDGEDKLAIERELKREKKRFEGLTSEDLYEITPFAKDLIQKIKKICSEKKSKNLVINIEKIKNRSNILELKEFLENLSRNDCNQNEFKSGMEVSFYEK